MAVNKEWMCMAHGAFESDAETPDCPHGCNTVQRAFLTPVGLGSARTASIDRTLQGLAAAHGMSDISNRGGRAAIRQDPNAARRQQEYSEFIRSKYGETGWGNVPQGGTMNTKTKEVVAVPGRAGGGAVAGLGAYGGRPDNVLAEVKDALVPKPVLVRHDHENLQVDLSKAA